MPLFAIYGWDTPQGPALRKVHREAHLTRLRALDAEGRVVLAGPLTDAAGTLMVVEFGDIEAASRWAAEDPYILNGVFDRTEVHPFTQVLPKP